MMGKEREVKEGMAHEADRRRFMAAFMATMAIFMMIFGVISINNMAQSTLHSESELSAQWTERLAAADANGAQVMESVRGLVRSFSPYMGLMLDTYIMRCAMVARAVPM